MFDPLSCLLAAAFRRRTMLATLAFVVAACGRADADPLDSQLMRHAPTVLKFCKSKGYKNVGVLKFRAAKVRGQWTDNVGPLNLDMATKLELALLLANRVQDPVGIVHDASSVAATIPARIICMPKADRRSSPSIHWLGGANT